MKILFALLLSISVSLAWDGPGDQELRFQSWQLSNGRVLKDVQIIRVDEEDKSVFIQHGEFREKLKVPHNLLTKTIIGEVQAKIETKIEKQRQESAKQEAKAEEEKRYPVVSFRIIQLADEGALVSFDGSSQNGFIIGWRSGVDGDRFTSRLKEVGVMSYTTVLNAKATIRKYEVYKSPFAKTITDAAKKARR
jgi:hypothetical protein